MENFQIFNGLVNKQFAYGGAKYAGDKSNPVKEATDYLVEDFSYLWLVGTCGKYAKRYKNTTRERDLLKTACYMFITWLKRGYHLSPQGSQEIIDTNVEIKTKFYDKFLSAIENNPTEGQKDITALYERCNEIVKRYLNKDVVMEYLADKRGAIRKYTNAELVQSGFKLITEDDFAFIYKSCFLIWQDKFKDNPGQDDDTYNECPSCKGKNAKSDLGATNTEK